MADTYLNQFVARGTAADRAAFTPSEPSPITGPVHAYLWWETDTKLLWAWDGSDWEQVTASRLGTITATFHGGGSALTGGVEAPGVLVPYDHEIVGAYLLADQAGDAEVDAWRDSLANYPPDVADSIVASAPMTLSSADASADTALSGWSVTGAAGAIYILKLVSASVIERLTAQLVVVKH